MTNPSQFDRSLLGLVVLTLVVTVAIALWDENFFALTYAAEDGPVEYATAFFLLVASVILASNVPGLARKARLLAAALTAFYAFLFFGAAGEEISWGQRIFGWETSERLKEINYQNETNFHNLVVSTPWGEIHLAKTLFGSFLTVVILLYLVVLPLLYPRIGLIKRLSDRFAVPVPGMRHGVLAIVASLVMVALESWPRNWEVYELVFSLLACSIFLRPQNRSHVS